MPLPLIVPIVLGATGLTWWKTKGKAKPVSGAKMTPTEEFILKSALDRKWPADKYNALADLFEKEGLTEPAKMLRARAAYGKLPPEVKAQHAEIVQKALASPNTDAIRVVAGELHSMGAIATAANLRRDADAKDAAEKVVTVPVPAVTAPAEPPAAEVHAAPAEVVHEAEVVPPMAPPSPIAVAAGLAAEPPTHTVDPLTGGGVPS